MFERNAGWGRRTIGAVVIAVTAVGAVGAMTRATVPSATGVISGCYVKSLGYIRLIDTDAGKHCSPFETAVQWNQTGPTGAQGQAGPSGPAGAPGPVGPPGPAGSGVTATFMFGGQVILNPADVLFQVTSKHLDAGSYALVATVSISEQGNFGGDIIDDLECELHNGTGIIGGATDRRVLPDLDRIIASLSFNGGAQVPPGGGDVSLWCRAQSGIGKVDNAQVMILKIAGFA